VYHYIKKKKAEKICKAVTNETTFLDLGTGSNDLPNNNSDWICRGTDSPEQGEQDIRNVCIILSLQ
jgi:hypothetical protein